MLGKRFALSGVDVFREDASDDEEIFVVVVVRGLHVVKDPSDDRAFVDDHQLVVQLAEILEDTVFLGTNQSAASLS